MKYIKSILLTFCLAFGFSWAGETLRFAHVYEATEPFHKWALWAADEIHKRTEGRYTIKVYPASTLGKEADINEGLQFGTVDIIYTGTGFGSRVYAPIGIAGAAYMFRDFNHWKAFAESDVFEKVAEGYKKQTGNIIIALNYYGERHMTSNKAIHSPVDMKGLRVRIPNATSYTVFPRAVGANPTPLAFDEVYLALQQGVVDAQENPLPTIRAKAFYEVQKYITLTGHIAESLLTVVGGPRWNKLTEEDQAIFRAVLKEAAKNNTAEIAQAEQQLIEWFRAQGTSVNTVDRKVFRDAVVNYYRDNPPAWDMKTYERLQALGQ